MTTLAQTRTIERGSRSGIWAALVERFQRYAMYRRTLAELEQLSRRELDDLGIAPSEIANVAMRAAYNN